MKATVKKRVLIFALDYYPGEVGGAEIAIKEITDRISPEEIEFHMVVMCYDSNMERVEEYGNVLVHRIGFGRPDPSIEERRTFPLHYNKHLFQLSAAFKARSLHKKYQYDAVWSMMAHSCGVPAAVFNLFYPKVPFMMTLQEGDPPEYIEKTMKPVWPLFTRAFRKASAIQVISSFLGQWATRMGHPYEPILIPNAVNTKHFAQSYPEAEIQAVRNELGKKAGDVFVITTSRMVPKNGLDLVVKALPQLPDHVHFVIYGGGPDKESLEALATTLGVRERVQFRGLISHEVMPKYLKACDIFIRPSRSEGMGNSFIEAMAAGVPVIATQAGGIADFLFDAKLNPEKPATGWAVPVDDVSAIADAVEAIMSDPESVARVIENAGRMVQEKYDWDLIAKDMQEKFFSSVLR